MTMPELMGIILAGGTGSRLRPLTNVTNKHLLPVGRKPMIFYPIEKLIGAGVKEILIVTGTEHIGSVVGLLGSGKDYGCHFTYRVQDEAGGIAQALALAENFCHGNPMVVILGDNIFEAAIAPMAQEFLARPDGAMILLKKVPDPQRYGVAELSGEKVVGIMEKPSHPKSDMAVTGIYLYDGKVFDVIRTLRPSARNELEITDVNNHYVSQGRLPWHELNGYWTDAGTFPSLEHAHRLVTGAASE
jgi:glucose-1-phosphate thymidylyltransferase